MYQYIHLLSVKPDHILIVRITHGTLNNGKLTCINVTGLEFKRCMRFNYLDTGSIRNAF